MATLQLWVSTLGTERTDWTREGTSPYLDAQDQPTNYVYSIVKKAEIGDFDFQNTTETGIINSVTLYIYGQTAVANNDFDIWNGATWTAYTPILPATWGWTSITVPVLDTWAKINGAKMYILHANSTSQTDIDAAYLLVDYTSTTVSSQESIVNFDAVSATKTAGGVPNTQTVQEYIKLFDVFGPSLASFQRQIQDYGNLGDTLTYRASIQQQIVEYITLSDTVSATAGVPPITQTIYDYANIAESINFQNIYIKAINENLRLDELFNTRTQFMRVWYETSIISEAANAYLSILRELKENLSISDLVTTRTLFITTLNDYMILFDVVTETPTILNIQIVNEWLNIFENQTRLTIFNRQIVEYITIFDAVTATTEELSNLILQLIKCVELP